MAYGRPRIFETPEDLMETFSKWRSEFAPGGDRHANGEIPDIEGFCDYIDSYRELFYEYSKKEEFSQTIAQIKNWIYHRKKQLAMQNKMNATVYVFDAKNNHGYVDKTEQDITTNGENIAQPIDANMLTQFLMTVQDNTKR